MKYTVKEDVWEDLITGQTYIRNYAFSPIVAFDNNGNVIKGYTYKPYSFVGEDGLSSMDSEKFGYRAYCLTQNLFLTEEQSKQRFKYLGKLERQEDIDESIRHYSEENCDFNNFAWLAELTMRDLTSKDAGGLSQCVQAKLLEFLFKHAESSEKFEEVKKRYFNNKGN
jgi:hypothetical protein